MMQNTQATRLTLAIVGVLLLTLGACDKGPATTSATDEAPAQETAPPAAEEAEESPAAWSPRSPEELDEDQRAQLQRAEAARGELAGRLMQRVMEVSQKDGLAAAVDVCHGEAPTITAEVAKKHELRIGRTSDRLRNPDNLPPEWAEAIFDADGTPALVIGPDGTLGSIHPIMLAEPCTNCHGAVDKLAPDVAQILAQRYPDDRATGYAAGDLRGWFWVEVPGR